MYVFSISTNWVHHSFSFFSSLEGSQQVGPARLIYSILLVSNMSLYFLDFPVLPFEVYHCSLVLYYDNQQISFLKISTSEVPGFESNGSA